MDAVDSGFLKYAPDKQVFGSSIAKILCSRCSVDKDAGINDLADELSRNKQIPAVAVMDGDKIEGIITRKNLFDLLGRAFGREVMGKKPVGKIIEQSVVFTENDTIFTVSEALDGQVDIDDIRYYLVKDVHGEYLGLFSSKDLLVFMADITRQDAHTAKLLQERLVKERYSAEKDGYEIESFSRPAGILGGDFYYINTKYDDHWFLTLCDVSGKGVSASIITSLLWGMVTMLDPRVGLKKFIKKLNQRIITTFHLEKYLTGVFLNLYPESGKVKLCDMGHSLIYLVRKGKIINLKSPQGNVPVGIMGNIEPTTAKFRMDKGDLLIILTDGLLEQTDKYGHEFSFKSFSGLVSKAGGDSLDKIRQRIITQFDKYRGNVPQHDDTTFILLRRK